MRPQSTGSISLRKGLIVALILGAVLSIFASILLELAIGAENSVAGAIIAMPFIEQTFKGLSIVIVALFVWKMIPNRRYAAALGAATGLGFAISETIIFAAGGAAGTSVVARIIGEPFMHPLWDAFTGVGVFVLMSQRSNRQGTPVWLGWLFLLTGLFAHIFWNSIATAAGNNVAAALVLDLAFVSVPFALLLRDFLGGHFNFQNFFNCPDETISRQPKILTPPPPILPPPPPP
jgi:RsiW-degrading membrane proteinase PrsW (M82 family)